MSVWEAMDADLDAYERSRLWADHWLSQLSNRRQILVDAARYVGRPEIEAEIMSMTDSEVLEFARRTQRWRKEEFA